MSPSRARYEPVTSMSRARHEPVTGPQRGRGARRAGTAERRPSHAPAANIARPRASKIMRQAVAQGHAHSSGASTLARGSRLEKPTRAKRGTRCWWHPSFVLVALLLHSPPSPFPRSFSRCACTYTCLGAPTDRVSNPSRSRSLVTRVPPPSFPAHTRLGTPTGEPTRGWTPTSTSRRTSTPLTGAADQAAALPWHLPFCACQAGSLLAAGPRRGRRRRGQTPPAVTGAPRLGLLGL